MNSQPRLPVPVSITPAPGVYGLPNDEMANSIIKNSSTKGMKKLNTSSSQQI
jgi:hypothetical protein